MKMIRVSQQRTSRVAPSFSVEMQAKHKIRMQFEIHQRCTASDFTVAVEQDLALPTDGLLFGRISRVKNIAARLWHAILDENLPGELAKIIWTLARRWLIRTSHEGHFPTEVTQSRRQYSRHAQGQIALLNRLTVADLEPTLLHLCPVAPQMPRIERDF